jgi:CDP-diglyceride synthetase
VGGAIGGAVGAVVGGAIGTFVASLELKQSLVYWVQLYFLILPDWLTCCLIYALFAGAFE